MKVDRYAKDLFKKLDNYIGSSGNGNEYDDDYYNAIDLLRNESPMYLLYSGSGPGFENGIKTRQEIVGEGEH